VLVAVGELVPLTADEATLNPLLSADEATLNALLSADEATLNALLMAAEAEDLPALPAVDAALSTELTNDVTDAWMEETSDPTDDVMLGTAAVAALTTDDANDRALEANELPSLVADEANDSPTDTALDTIEPTLTVWAAAPAARAKITG